MMHSPVRSRQAATLTLVGLAGLALAAPALAQDNPLQRNVPPAVAPAPPQAPPPKPDAAPAPVEDGPSYPVTSIALVYATEHPDRPAPEQLRDVPVTLGVLDGVLVAARPGLPTERLTLGELEAPAAQPRRIAVSGLNAIGAAVVGELNRRGLIGVLVVPDSAQIDPATLEDRRGGAGGLSMLIYTRTVQQVRTVGEGRRWERPSAGAGAPSQETRINAPQHRRIRENSPLQPAPEGEQGDLLRKDELDDYLFRLNRHPGRRVDAAIAAGDTPGSVALDYVVTENRPWTAYAQLSNTGTEQTSEWRQRFGFIHNQLTGNDDIFSVDYTTAAFDSANAVTLSYDRPIGSSDRLRTRLYGTYSDFTASDVGLGDEEFTGTTWGAGGELIYNIWQRRETFIDVFGGVRWQDIEVNNEIVDLRGKTDFIIPYLGARFERSTIKAATTAEARLEFGTGGDEDEAERLGRLQPDVDWTVLRWNVAHSFYLEPLLMGRAWDDPATPDNQVTLAHEIALSARGQAAFGNRLIPQEQDVVGGLYSVRGYEESEAAGDTTFIASAEYRFHLPRLWQIQPDPSQTPLFGQPFRRSPQQRYGLPDWDLVFKGFIDVGRVVNSDRLSFEEDETLIGIGPGIEFAYRRNVTVRADWGFALKEGPRSKSGDSRLHLVVTLVY